MKRIKWIALSLTSCLCALTAVGAETAATQASSANNEVELAKRLQNPVASLIVVPLQNNFDWGAGPNHDGFQWKMNIQPVVPIALSEDWNLIWRTILPVVSQTDIAGTRQNPSGTQTGLSDTLASFFFSPRALGPGGVIWGLGPALYFPTGTDDLLGTGKWGAGPTGVALRQTGAWTYGALVNHIWSYAGSGSRPDLNNTFLQPFVAYTTKKSTTFGMNSETSYNWEASQWLVPLNAYVTQLQKIGGQLVLFGLGGRWYPEAPANGPEWGLRFSLSFLFPK